MSHAMAKSVIRVGLPLVLATAMTGVASAADYYLRAEAFTKSLPDPAGGADVAVPMWGFARDDGFEGTELEPVSSPGPVLTVPDGDNTLTIHVDNNLAVDISIVIPGQITTMTPEFFTDGQGRQRAWSFTHVTEAGNTADVTYTWSNLEPGTYLYHSGTHPQVQVQMGLYGAVTHDAAAGEAYSGRAYDQSVLLLYSEIDPLLHEQVDDDSYGDPNAGGMTSTIDYNPKYFLVNGEPYTGATAPLAAGNPGDAVLIRLLNAGLKTHVPLLLGPYLDVIAEDGKPYTFALNSYVVELPAGTTKDALVTFGSVGAYPIYDRAMSLSNAGAMTAGGMLRVFEVTAP